MKRVFIIEDEAHAEPSLEFFNREDVVAELKRLADIPWDHEPNRAPCMSWKTCGRDYEVVEYDQSKEPWTILSRTPALEINAKGVVWSKYFNT